MNTKNNKFKTSRLVLVVILAFLVALLLTGFILLKNTLGRIDRTYDDAVETVAPQDEFFELDVTPSPVPSTPTPSNTPTHPNPNSTPDNTDQSSDTSSAPEAPEFNIEWSPIQPIEDDHLINILLVGQDKYPYETYAGRQRSDSMILCSINTESKQVSLISFLRDSYVQIPGGYSDNRLNAPYAFGGFDLLDKTLTLNFGVSIDANFSVDMASFETLINMVGGVDIQLTAAEAEHMQSLGLNVAEGWNHLNGLSARVYSQIRAIGNDFARTGRQRVVLLAAFEKIKDLPASDLLALITDMLPYLSTDLTDAEILSLACHLIPIVTSVNIETHLVPDHDCYTSAYIRGMSVLVPDREKVRQRLSEEYLPLN